MTYWITDVPLTVVLGALVIGWAGGWAWERRHAVSLDRDDHMIETLHRLHDQD